MKKIKRQPITLTAPVNLSRPSESEARTFAIAAYTGAVIDTWYGKLAFEVAGMSAKKSMPILREHQRDRIVGYGTGKPDGDVFSVSGQFSTVTPDARECLALADEGYPWQASVGIRPVKVKTLSEKEEAVVNGKTLTGPAEIWLKSEVGEVSFVSLGADSNTSIAVFGESATDIEAEHEQTTETKEKSIMTKEELLAQAPELVAELKQEGVAAERERVTQILASDPELKHLAVLTSAIEAGTPADGIYKALFEAERQIRKSGIENLAAQATPPVGQTRSDEPVSAPPISFMDKARSLAREKGLSLAQSVRLAQAEFPDLHEAYLKEQRHG